NIPSTDLCATLLPFLKWATKILLMGTSRSLPVLLPVIDGQRWSCHSCGLCCRTLVGHLTAEERRRLDGQGWAQQLGVAPYVKIGRGWALNKQPDGACVFLDEQNRCKIHAKFGEADKPLACRIFPFSVRPVRGAWQASLRFDCPSVTSSKGVALGGHRGWLGELVGRIEHDDESEDIADFHRGVRATVEELRTLTARLSRWLSDGEKSMTDRLIGATRLTATLYGAKLRKVRGPRFAELLDLLLEALPRDCATRPELPTARQRAMLRQYAFAHAEHVSLAEMRSGLGGRWAKRWQQLHSAKQFLRGEGVVPNLPGFDTQVTFASVEAVGPAVERGEEIADLVRRYLSARIEGRTVFGGGFYGWSVFAGLGALWLLTAATGWLARYHAAVERRTSISFEDFALALGIVDRAATRLPALGTMTEKARLSYLMGDDGLARLMMAYAALEPVP
ncbi:MAG: YkgJ family cysteine cluster protein, partial [Planctomycetota bacterium]